MWQAAVSELAEPLRAQLAALEEQHCGVNGSLRMVQATLANLTAQADLAQAALQDVQVGWGRAFTLCVVEAMFGGCVCI